MIIRNVLTCDWQCATSTVILEYFAPRCKSRKTVLVLLFPVLAHSLYKYVVHITYVNVVRYWQSQTNWYPFPPPEWSSIYNMSVSRRIAHAEDLRMNKKWIYVGIKYVSVVCLRVLYGAYLHFDWDCQTLSAR